MKIAGTNISNTTLYLLIGGGLLVVVLLVMWFMSDRKGKKGKGKSPKGDAPDPGQGGQQPPAPPTQTADVMPTLVFFHMDSCPHCTHMQPVWAELTSVVPQDSGLLLRDINAADPEMGRHRDIKGFPTIRLFPQGLSQPAKYVDYKGERSVQGIIGFLQGPPQGGQGGPQGAQHPQGQGGAPRPHQ